MPNGYMKIVVINIDVEIVDRSEDIDSIPGFTIGDYEITKGFLL